MSCYFTRETASARGCFSAVPCHTITICPGLTAGWLGLGYVSRAVKLRDPEISSTSAIHTVRVGSREIVHVEKKISWVVEYITSLNKKKKKFFFVGLALPTTPSTNGMCWTTEQRVTTKAPVIKRGWTPLSQDPLAVESYRQWITFYRIT